MTSVIEKPRVNKEKAVWIESHHCRVQTYHRLFVEGVRAQVPIAQLNLLCFVRDKLAARNGSGVTVAIRFDDFKSTQAVLGIDGLTCLKAWDAVQWQFTVQSPARR